MTSIPSFQDLHKIALRRAHVSDTRLLHIATIVADYVDQGILTSAQAAEIMGDNLPEAAQ